MVTIDQELVALCAEFRKKEDRGSSFKPFRYHKHSERGNEPVFFIGVPGLATAVTVTVMAGLAFGVAGIGAAWWGWTLFGLFAIVCLRIGMKVDKVRQIRFFCFSLAEQALKLIERANAETDAQKRAELLKQALTMLQKADSMVQEPSIERQIAHLQ